MENKVLFRELKDSDIPALEDVVRKTWDYDKFATPKAAKRLAEAYLSTCLSDQTYTPVSYTHLDVYKRQYVNKQYR